MGLLGVDRNTRPTRMGLEIWSREFTFDPFSIYILCRFIKGHVVDMVHGEYSGAHCNYHPVLVLLYYYCYIIIWYLYFLQIGLLRCPLAGQNVN